MTENWISVYVSDQDDQYQCMHPRTGSDDRVTNSRPGTHTRGLVGIALVAEIHVAVVEVDAPGVVGIIHDG